MDAALSDKKVYDEFEKLINKFNITSIIETGTHLGGTAVILSKFNIPVDSIEIVESNYRKALESTKGIPNIRLHLGSSSELLFDILKDKTNETLIFLDAHCFENPIENEFNAIIKSTLKPIIVIHDFFVPDANGNPIYPVERIQNGIFNYNFIKPFLDKIYSESGYGYYYNDGYDSVAAGLIYIYPIL